MDGNVKAEAFKELVLNTLGENIVVLRLPTVILVTLALVTDRLSLLIFVPILTIPLFPDCPLKLT